MPSQLKLEIPLGLISLSLLACSFGPIYLEATNLPWRRNFQAFRINNVFFAGTFSEPERNLMCWNVSARGRLLSEGCAYGENYTPPEQTIAGH